MTQKFGRNYRVTIDPKDGGPKILVTLGQGFTMRFFVQRTAFGDLNHASIELYNLGPDNRARIFQDSWIPGLNPANTNDTVPGRTITVELGYQNLYQVFTGIIQQASTQREGTNLITSIDAMDSRFDIAASQTYQTLESGQSVGSVIQFLVGQFPTLTLGGMGSWPDIIQRPVALNGPTWDLLKRYSSSNVYIDNSKIYVLRNNETLKNQVQTINDSTGLLQTPRRTEGQLQVVTLMEPGLEMFQQVNLQSSVNPVFNGQYKIIGLTHQGIISPVENGRCTTSLSLNAPAPFQGFKEVQGA